jgi:hypothetical protein
MTDYGFRISTEGNDVKECVDLETIINSKYAVLKGALAGSGEQKVNNGDSETIHIATAYGYPPFAQVFIEAPNGLWAICPFVASVAMQYMLEVHYRMKADGLYIKMTWDDLSGDDNHIHVKYKYFIYADKAKV